MGSLADFRRRRFDDVVTGVVIGAGIGAAGIAIGLLRVLFGGGPVEVPVTAIAVTGAFGGFLALAPRAWVGAVAGFVVSQFHDVPGTYWQTNESDFAWVFWLSLASLVLYLPTVVAALPEVVARARSSTASAASSLVAVGRRRSPTLRGDPRQALRRSLSVARRQGLVAARVRPPPLTPVLTRERDLLILVATAIFYAVARWATDRFYGSFGVTAEEVGVTTPSLLLGAALTTIALLLVGLGAVWVIRFLTGFSIGRFVLLVSAGAGFGLESLSQPRWTDAAIWAVVGVATWWLIDDRPFWTAAVGSRALVVLAAGLVAGMAILALQVSGNSVDNVRSADSNTPAIGPFALTPLHAPTVAVWPVDGAVLPAELDAGACVSWLGSSGGVSVLHRSGRVWRLPNENVVLVSAVCEE